MPQRRKYASAAAAKRIRTHLPALSVGKKERRLFRPHLLPVKYPRAVEKQDGNQKNEPSR